MGFRIQVMRQHIALSRFTRLLNRPQNKRNLFISSFVTLLSCLIFVLVERVTPPSKTGSKDGLTAIFMPTAPTASPTKWWIKATAIPSSTPPSISGPIDPAMPATSNCASSYSSPLQPEIYAYISLNPPLPNRIRSDAGKASSYLGQIEPGRGVKVLEGPVCADGLSWWLVESTQGGLRGWTADGRESQQWVIPCPNPTVACFKKPLSTPTQPASTESNKTQDNGCKSEKLSVGILAQVEQGNLLVVRSEPNTGEVIGRAGPLSVVNILDGPVCIGSDVWWKLNIDSIDYSGWATENNLFVCSKEDGCS